GPGREFLTWTINYVQLSRKLQAILYTEKSYTFFGVNICTADKWRAEREEE
ncbi:hypothetical protein Bpfe_006269, partial [Biomphalaria pfeifferi]